MQGFPAIVSNSHKEGSINADLQEATGDHKDGKISDEGDNHKEVLGVQDETLRAEIYGLTIKLINL